MREVNYRIAQSPSGDGLCELVKEAMTKGYRPIGGVSVIAMPTGFGFWQALLLDREIVRPTDSALASQPK